MSNLVLICGLPGAGKTTLAKQLEVQMPALRLCPDEWIMDIYGPEIDRRTLDAARDPVESTLWKLAVRALTLGLDVILEYGLWARIEREDYRSRAEALGAKVELHFVDAPPEELWRRIETRNAELPPSYRNHRHELAGWLKVFQPPTPDEFR
jgi:predicted kinase